MADNFSVQLYVYDLTQGLAAELSLPLLGKKIDGVWHTGVVVYGVEFFFGSMGISSCPPGQTILGQPTNIIPLGTTQIPRELFDEFLTEMGQSRFQGSRYRLLEHNCNNFSCEVSQFLTGKGIPSHITSLPGEVMATPFGAMIRPLLESMSPQPAAAASNQMRASLPSPYVAPVPQSTAASSSQPAKGSISGGQVQPNSVLASTASTSAVITVGGVSSSSESKTDACHTTDTAALRELPPIFSRTQCGGKKSPLWNTPYSLFVARRHCVKAVKEPQSDCERLASELPRVVLVMAEGDNGNDLRGETTGTLSSHMQDCLVCLRKIMESYEKPWLDALKSQGLDSEVGDGFLQTLDRYPAMSDFEGLLNVGHLLFALTVVTGSDGNHFMEAQLVFFRLLNALWPAGNSPGAEPLRIAVFRLLLQLSVHDAWQRQLVSCQKWPATGGKEASNVHYFLPVLVDGILDTSVEVQQLAVACANNICLQLADEQTAMECAVALAQCLQEPKNASATAFESLFRCLAVNEDFIGPVLGITGLPAASLASITAAELQPAMQRVIDILPRE